MTNNTLSGAAFLVASVICASPAHAQVLQGIAMFEQRCGACHSGSAAANNRAPDRAALSQLTPEAVLDAMTTGSMAVNATGMTNEEKRVLAEQLTGRPLGTAQAGQAAAMPNRCSARPTGDPFAMPMWNGWGNDLANSRFQPAAAAGLTAAQVPKLTLKWAFGFPNGSSAYAQPTIAGGRVFVGSDIGFVYALDARSGCVHWSYQAQAGVRTAISFGRIGNAAPARHAVYFGDLKANVFALDADTGALLWTKRADSHPLARITGAPALQGGRLYVPLSSLEEAAGANPKYECCTFRGAVVAYDANTGEQIWKTYTIADTPKPTKKNSAGTQLWTPSGAATWSSPTVDVKRGVLYVATGNAYTDPAPPTSDAVLALDLKTGKIVWSNQVTPADAFIIGCGAGAAARDNCPEETGPDFDFGNSAILRTLPDGRSVLVIGQKSGVVWALDPDKRGAVVWQRRIGKGSALGGLEWGSAADERVGYFPVSDVLLGPDVAGGLYAIGLGSGEQLWSVRPPLIDCRANPRSCIQAQSAAITVIPGAVFSGATNGVMRAYSTIDGRVIWEYDSARDYTTVNGVKARGGAINGPGPTVAGGMLFMNSGYAYLGALPGNTAGNVLLAFGID
jgi:polyvinyl alcohol dehydrogenase (cytochrome)